MTEDRVALITGGASGMGLATAESLSASGWKVSILDMNQKAGEEVAARLGGLFTRVNVTVYDELAAGFGLTWKKYGRIDFVFANAGIVARSDFYEQQKEDANGFPLPPDLLSTKVMFDGVIMTMHLAIHFLRKNATPGGSIIVTASSGGIYPSPHAPLYSAAKHGAVAMTRSAASRLENENIHVSCICPGTVATGLMSKEDFASFDQATFTPLSKIVEVINLLLQRGEDTRGAAVEIITDRHYFRWRPDYCDDRMELCWNSMGGSTTHCEGGINRS